MVAVVQPGVAARSGDVVMATIDGASDHAVHVEHVAYFQSREPF